MMRHSFKLIGASALALALSYGGYGALNVGQGASAAPNGAANADVAFAPAVRSDAAFVLGATLDKDKLWGIIDVFLDKLIALSGAQGEQIKAIKAELTEYKANPFKDVSEGNAFLKESGLLDADVRWAVMSTKDMPKFGEGSSIPSGLALAVAGRIDVRKFMSAFQRKLSEKEIDAAEFKEDSVEGEKVWRLVPLNDQSAKEMKKDNVDLHVAWLDNQLVIAAQSRDVLAKQIRLYRKGEGKSNALHGFSSADTAAGLFMVGLGEIMRQTVPEENLVGLNAMPNGKQIFYGLKTLAIKLGSASGEDVHLSLRLVAASETDADVLRTFAKTGLMAGRAQLSQMPEQASDLLKALEAVKIGGVNGVVEVSLDIPMSVLCSALHQVMMIGNATEGDGNASGPAKRQAPANRKRTR